MMTHPRVLERLYRIALLAHPPDVRRRLGDEMVRTFTRVVDRARRCGRLALTRRVVAELADVVGSGIGVRLSHAAGALPSAGSALRRLARRPAYPLAVAGTLTLGVGASTAVVSVVGVVVLDALPFPDADRLVHVWDRELPGNNPMPSTTPGSFLAWRELDGVFTAVEGFHRDTRVLSGEGLPEAIRLAVTTPGLFDLLGVRPVMGRTFRDPEGRPGDDAWVLIGERLWARRFGSDPGLVGRTVTLDGESVTVLGIMPRDFAFPERDYEAWMPVAATASALTPAEGPPPVPSLDVIARLRPGLERAAGNEALVERADDLAAAGATPGHVPALFDLGFFMTPERTRDTLVLLAGAVLFVLLIAAANVVSLGLSRAADRRRELAVRRALGAGPGRLLGELLAENAVLAAAGSALGLVVAHVVLSGLAPRIPGELGINTWGRGLTIWPHGALFAIVAAAVTAPVATLLTRVRPGRASDATLASARTTGNPGSLRAQQLLMAGQMALAVILLSGTALMAASVLRLQRTDTGYDLDRLLLVSLRIPTADVLQGTDRSPDARAAATDDRLVELEAALGRLPGVVSMAGTTSPLPLAGARFRPELETADGGPVAGGEREEEAGMTPARAGAMFLPINEVTPGFFGTTGIALLRGRDFSDADDPDATVILNRVLAERLWPGEEAVGRTMRVHPDAPWRTVVGVAEPAAQMGFRDPWGDGGEVYVPLDRAESVRPPPVMPRSDFHVTRTYLLRTADDPPAALMEEVRRAVWDLDPDQPIERLMPLDQAYGGTIQRERFFLALLGVFAAIATALATAGIYALLSRSLARRTRELGIRVALGAGPGRVLARLTRSGLGPSVAGVLIGLAAAWPLSTLLADLLYQIEPGDPLTLALTAAGLLTVAALACVLPARRALRTDVVEAIRDE